MENEEYGEAYVAGVRNWKGKEIWARDCARGIRGWGGGGGAG